jgi:hypothetical protein
MCNTSASWWLSQRHTMNNIVRCSVLKQVTQLSRRSCRAAFHTETTAPVFPSKLCVDNGFAAVMLTHLCARSTSAALNMSHRLMS